MTAGTYGGVTFGSPFGFGGGLYIDSHGRIYPQIYGGTPKWSLSAGYSPDLEALLTGTSISGSLGSGSLRFNGGTSGSATGIGFGTPGIGVTYGFGPLEMSHDFSRPWVTTQIHDSVAAAGIPDRYNVWEYGYPNPGTAAPSSSLAPSVNEESNDRSSSSTQAMGPVSSTPMGSLSNRIAQLMGTNAVGPTLSAPLPQMGLGRVNSNPLSLPVFDAGAPPIPYLPTSLQNKPGGLLGMMIDAGQIDPSMPDQPAVGGLVGLIQDYLRNNPGGSL